MTAAGRIRPASVRLLDGQLLCTVGFMDSPVWHDTALLRSGYPGRKSHHSPISLTEP